MEHVNGLYALLFTGVFGVGCWYAFDQHVWDEEDLSE